MKKYISLQEIVEIYCISRKLVRDVLMRYSVDCYKQEDVIYIDFKSFHKIYTTKYNPTLFPLEEEVREQKKTVIENSLNRTFFSIFSEPINCKQRLRNMVMAYSE
jgi:hypothetical protein